MIEILEAPDHVAAFRLAGILKAEDYKKVIPKIEERLADHEQIGVLVDMTGLEDITAGALHRDIQYGIEKRHELHRFKRAGVISDKQWVEAVMAMAAALFPQIEMRVFAPDEEQEALRWTSALQ